MLSVTVVCVGRLKEKHFLLACEEYMKRLRPFVTLSVVEVAERPAEMPRDIPQALVAEGEAIDRVAPKGAFRIALSPEGKQMTSEALAAKLDMLAVGGASRLCFLIGGSNGLCERIKRQADFLLSMSEMTFPHHLARVMLLEQLYRAFSILNHTKYHK